MKNSINIIFFNEKSIRFIVELLKVVYIIEK